LQQAQGQQIEEYLARNFAEAVARLMRLKLKLRSRYGQPMSCGLTASSARSTRASGPRTCRP
jgi:hypothetical protein